MPEGDTVHKLAAFLAPRLAGGTIRHGRIRRSTDAGLDGRRVLSVFARGKHLFIELDDGRLLRSHLGMYGSWHRYAPGEPWKKPARQAVIELRTDEEVYVCFNAKDVELLRGRGVRARVLGTRLGPDLVEPEPDLASIPARARELLDPDAILADVLLDQRVACGVGNVYKSEVLFLEGLDPRARLGDVGDADLAALYATAHALLRRNLGEGPRVTRFEGGDRGRTWVYGRHGLPCLRCGERIRSERMGSTWRSTYRCPRCQQARARPAGAAR